MVCNGCNVLSQKDFDLLTGPLIPDVNASCTHCESILEATGNIAVFTRPIHFHHYLLYAVFGVKYWKENKWIQKKKTVANSFSMCE